jgi:C-terminal processing protease CtpA/Prc
MRTLAFQYLTACVASLALLSAAVLGDEPQKENAAAQEKAVDDLAAARLRLTQQIDQSAWQNLATFEVDLDQLLVSGNGLGIEVAAPEATLRAQLGLEEEAGLVVTSAPDESQGAKAGLKVHDVIVELGGQKVGKAEKLSELLDGANGKQVKLRVLRSGKVVEVQATPKKPELARLWWSNLDRVHADTDLAAQEDQYRIGVHLSEADDTLRSQLRLATGEGLVVTEVVADSAASQAGIQPHDVLIMLDGKRLMTVDAINAQIKETKERKVELRLLRSGKEVVLEIAPRKSQEPTWATRSIRYWDTKSCQSCHSNVHDLSHANMAWKLGAHRSAWTDGRTAKLFLHDWISDAKTADAPTGAPQQIEALKAQLAEMQKTLASLEATLQQPAKTDEKKD